MMKLQLTPERVRDEIADLIDRGRTNKQIVDYFADGVDDFDRREFGKGVTKIRHEIKAYWKPMGGHAAGELW